MTAPLSVSVVIPTANGRDWRRAVASAFSQRNVNVEVILVNNGTEDVQADAQYPTLRIINSDPSSGANGARQAGVLAATNELIALLDDDDEWLPEKLTRQWQHVQSSGVDSEGSPWLCGTGKFIVEKGKADLLSPVSFPSGVDDVAEYLFMRKYLKSARNQLQSSTLFFPRQVAVEVPFDPSLRLHQDWNWVLDVEEKLSAKILVCPEYLVRYYKSASAGITSTSRPSQSLGWASMRLASKPQRIQGDFALSVPFNMALEKGQYLDAVGIFRDALQKARPGIPAITRAFLALARYPVLRVLQRASPTNGGKR
ncbi:glycosyltransferase family 2 protein [Arthrobacter nitrophenolicus]|uniref:Glycosyltransferase family 2 protein n=1 Tax=Arthrobacter nitrophenolicus TaxID=683150 RepID=A0A4R5Y2U3_9MICC|nr:glycosyltransferase family 2 protein [Arthrobacter nitrophenolicus]TDL37402.1 glycosyltransferase family 2 protein [Arthrobacter nitrophenolicus]